MNERVNWPLSMTLIKTIRQNNLSKTIWFMTNVWEDQRRVLVCNSNSSDAGTSALLISCTLLHDVKYNGSCIRRDMDNLTKILSS